MSNPTVNTTADPKEETKEEKPCYWCNNLVKGDRLTYIRDCDGGSFHETVWDINFCPVCGKELRDEDEEDE